MEDLIERYTDKLDIKKHLFLIEDTFEIYSNVQKAASKIQKSSLNSTLVEVVDQCRLNDEVLYLVSANGNELGWMTTEKPLFIFNTFNENVLVTDANTDNEINNILNLYSDINKEEIYIKNFFTIYEGHVYFGLTKEDQLITFLPDAQITNGDIKPVNFKFKQMRNNVFEDIYQKVSSHFISSDVSYECIKIIYFNNAYFGKFKIGRMSYWFNINDTDIDIDTVEYKPSFTSEELKLSHLFYTVMKEESASPQKIDEKVIQNRFNEYNEKINELQDEITRLKSEMNNPKEDEI
ncbi:hypothetical protein [Jeotgalicoccus sp. ATCC 8456]|uniref:hypothetical protein n=1 Tax=Jeotgalicoccus sp. ATCC 8456 TaxID=946435 RepID=UPI0018E5D96B|nr:hypothetical protein [Jeotgalicoccus sp. ATCC 8456]QQD85675.1 hypothetical protein JEM45_03355 [Jeotgalicoccus sp. ATCC 8456]